MTRAVPSTHPSSAGHRDLESTPSCAAGETVIGIRPLTGCLSVHLPGWPLARPSYRAYPDSLPGHGRLACLAGPGIRRTETCRASGRGNPSSAFSSRRRPTRVSSGSSTCPSSRTCAAESACRRRGHRRGGGAIDDVNGGACVASPPCSSPYLGRHRCPSTPGAAGA